MCSDRDLTRLRHQVLGFKFAGPFMFMGLRFTTPLRVMVFGFAFMEQVRRGRTSCLLSAV